MHSLRIGNLSVSMPIVQGGMGVCVSLSGLASAVANEGGIGIISAVGIGMTEPDYRKNFKEANKIALRKEIRKARSKTDGVIGVNIMIAVTDFEDLLRVAIDERVDVVTMGAGLPLNLPPSFLESETTKFLPKVSSGRAANIIFQSWSNKYNRVPDAVVVEGPKSGGHQGFKKHDLVESRISLTAIVKDTIQAIIPYEQKYGLEIPVIAGGGIYTGKDVFEIMSIGAKGVKMGTRFVTTNECDVSEKFKQNYIDCSKEDIVIIDSPVGLPARTITNDFVKEIQAGKRKPIKCPWKCLKTCDYKKVQFCIAEALFNAAKGDFTKGFSFAGEKAYLAERIMSVKETMDEIEAEYYQEEAKLRLAKVVSYC
jgi:NAD(P)H-dependent flavin oxidoreductase YrpB (nitropropane dioxygenase family)